jgi:hypothetical protein
MDKMIARPRVALAVPSPAHVLLAPRSSFSSGGWNNWCSEPTSVVRCEGAGFVSRFGRLVVLQRARGTTKSTTTA